MVTVPRTVVGSRVVESPPTEQVRLQSGHVINYGGSEDKNLVRPGGASRIGGRSPGGPALGRLAGGALRGRGHERRRRDHGVPQAAPGEKAVQAHPQPHRENDGSADRPHYAAGPPRLPLREGEGALYDRLTSAVPLPLVEEGPKVSVLLATHDAARTLPTALRALSEQTWRNLEILVIDDLRGMRDLISDCLKNANYAVLRAPNGKRGLEIAKESEPHLIIVDWMMPQMSGPELAARLEVSCPGLRVVYMSGYTARVATQQRLLPADVPVLAKPFSPSALLRRIREVLDAPRLVV